MKNWLITGADGFLGSGILEYYRTNKEINVSGLSRKELDFTNADAAMRILETYQPDVLIHTAAISDTGVCEQKPDLSYAVNVMGTVNLACACARNHVRMISCSSDQVYAGSWGLKAHTEDEHLSPSNVYGRHKLETEARCLEICPDSISLRLTWLYEIPAPKSNMALIIQEAVRERKTLSLSTNDYRGLTWREEVISNLQHLESVPGGVYNWGGENPYDYYETVRKVLEGIGASQELAQADSRQYAEAPRNLAMNTAKIRKYGISFTDTGEGLIRILKQHQTSH